MKILSLLFILFFTSLNARAELLLEPLVGHNFHSHLKISEKDTYYGTGLGFGGRIGYQKLGLQLGLDYLHSNIKFDYHEFGRDLSFNEFGVFAGFEFPILVRIYAGFTFAAYGSGKYDNKTGQGEKDFELNSGTGYKLGASFTGIPFIVLNLEYRNVRWDEYDSGNKTVGNEVNYNAYLFSVSVPFVF